jgi:biofilm PGA synthesis N-glycosyltransferase PgaC
MHKDLSTLTYALITPAWNEEAHLPELIRSVVAQTMLPVAWVIVSDGSTDRTDEIVRRAAEAHPWIRLLRREREGARHFAGKAHAVNAAYQSIAGLPFDLIGNLDADMTLPPDYYAFLIDRFAADPALGVAGTPFVEDAARPDVHTYAHAFADLSHVSGACQFFRRACFDQIGGYIPMKQGGIDWVAVTTARMLGWTTRTFVEKASFHHRTMGTADRSLWRARFNHGQKDYLVGGHPVWQLFRGVFQMRSRPVVVGGACLIAGYLSAWAMRKTTAVPADLRAFHRGEQLDRLRRFVRRRPKAAAGGRPPVGATAARSLTP